MHEAGTHDGHVLSGSAVTDARGNPVGKIEDLMIDLEEGRVAYAVLSFGRIQGMQGKLFAVPWEALTSDPQRAVFMLDVDRRRLEGATVFDRENAYPRLLWSPAPFAKGPIGMISGRAPVADSNKRGGKAQVMRNVAFADAQFRVHR